MAIVIAARMFHGPLYYPPAAQQIRFTPATNQILSLRFTDAGAIDRHADSTRVVRRRSRFVFAPKRREYAAS